MISPSRRECFDILRRIEIGSHFSDYALNSAKVQRLEPRDRNLTTEIVYGTLRWKLLLDHVLACFTDLPWQDVDEEIRIILRMSVYQMWRMDRVPDHALVNDAVELAKNESGRSRSSTFVNGVLRRLSRERPWNQDAFARDFPPWIRASIPRWLWNRWKRRFGEGCAMEYALSLNQPPRYTFWSEEVTDIGRQMSEACESSDLVPGAFFALEPLKYPGLRAQDEASQLIPHLLGSVNGWRVWDACAAPGGKSAILSRLCGKTGCVVSSDYHWRRTSRLARTLGHSHGKKPLVLAANAANAPPFRISFDCVFVDVPCSGLGTLRRNPEIKWRCTSADLSSHQRSQITILSSCAQAVRVGGLLLYSTCSTEPEENEQVLEAFLEQHRNFRLTRPKFPPGVERWVDENGLLRTYPSTRLWDGFFAGIMARFS